MVEVIFLARLAVVIIRLLLGQSAYVGHFAAFTLYRRSPAALQNIAFIAFTRSLIGGSRSGVDAGPGGAQREMSGHWR